MAHSSPILISTKKTFQIYAISRLQNAGPSFVSLCYQHPHVFSGQIGWNLEEAVDCNDLGIYTDRSRDQDIPRNSVRTFLNASISLTPLQLQRIPLKGTVLWMVNLYCCLREGGLQIKVISDFIFGHHKCFFWDGDCWI